MDSLKLCYTYTYVKVLLQVMFGKYTAGTRVEVTNTTWGKANVVYDTRPHPEYCIFGTSWLRAALTDLLLCVGRIINSISGELKTSFVSASWEDR